MSFDLHTHTTGSDGSYTPEELIIHAAKKGITGISITDHDSISAYPSAFEIAKREGVELIPGVEFSCHFKEQSVHVLGYSFKIDHPEIIGLCLRHKERRVNRNRQILEKLKGLGIAISEEELNASTKGAIGRPHIANILVEKGHVCDIKEAFKVYIGEGKKAFASGDFFSVEETLNIIHKAGGLAILAHPHLCYSHSFVRELFELPFDGIESYYAQMPKNKNAPWIAFAKERNLIMTGGSDFHGNIKPTPLGATLVSREQITLILTKFYESYDIS